MRRRLYGEVPTLEAREESHERVDKALRYAQIKECLRNKELTAKEIAVAMQKKGYIPTSERNFVSPRLTEMMKKGIVEPIGKKACTYTGRTVAVWQLIEE